MALLFTVWLFIVVSCSKIIIISISLIILSVLYIWFQMFIRTIIFLIKITLKLSSSSSISFEYFLNIVFFSLFYQYFPRFIIFYILSFIIRNLKPALAKIIHILNYNFMFLIVDYPYQMIFLFYHHFSCLLSSLDFLFDIFF